MVFGLFGRRFADDTIDLYGSIVAEARRPLFYAEWGVPDTVTGRFDMIVLTTAVVLRRLAAEPVPPDAASRRRRGGVDPRERGRQLLDLFFTEMDRALREMGVGDLGVPKRIKKLAAAWNGRFQAYDGALAEDDAAALTAAIARNVLAGLDDRSGAEPLAAHVRAASRRLAETPIADVLAGRIAWPDPSPTVTRTTP